MIRSSYALINFVKAMCGVGVFALPLAFRQAGLWMGAILALALGVVNAHSMIKLVRCSQHLSKKKELSEDYNKSTVTAIPMTSSSERTSHAVSVNNIYGFGRDIKFLKLYYNFARIHWNFLHYNRITQLFTRIIH
ncbi:hypothetical protein ANCCEY_10175 [Ancylostoma ceylanicum]|uniref:Amino acid transporter transmembrane domain-containing protein n=1 Tax=Ancylostoma ceylanicum TaxID=53326 RepID=A0A0D6LSU8_9BILA|nr:hypothetical protein ANCCEY_10175 [Ancylostoma ceylanicum]